MRHLPDPANLATEITHTVIQQLLHKSRHASIEHTDIRSVTAEVLARFDQAASTHYQAFHKG